MKMIAVAPHHRFVQPILALYISFGVGCYCFIHAKAMREAILQDKADIVPTPFYLSAFIWELVSTATNNIKTMETNLNVQQKAAISQFLNHLSNPSFRMKWNKEELFDVFSSYSLPHQTDLDYSSYDYALRTLPFAVKRDFVCKILNSWKHAAQADSYTLYKTLQDLLYMKIETGVECVLFNNILNLIDYFNAPSVRIKARCDTNFYMIEVYPYVPNLSSSDSQVLFTTSTEDETPRVEYLIGAELLKRKINFTMQPSQTDVSIMLKVLTENHTKKHCPWINLKYSLGCTFDGWSLQITYNDIEYVDNNGL